MSDAELNRAIALAREVLHRSGALRVNVALTAQEGPVVVECERLRAIVVRDADGERELPHDVAGDVDLGELPPMTQVPPFEVDAEEGQVAGMIGGLQMLARAVHDVAALLPAGSVVAAEYETDTPDMPLGLAARAGEPLVVLLGDEEFELELGA